MDLNKVLLIGSVKDTALSVKNEFGEWELTFTLTTRNFFFNKGTKEKADVAVHHPIRYITKSDKLSQYLTEGRYLFIEGFIKQDRGQTLHIEAYNIQLIGAAPKKALPDYPAPASINMPEDDLPY